MKLFELIVIFVVLAIDTVLLIWDLKENNHKHSKRKKRWTKSKSFQH
jgi:hypothetical protein